MKIKIRTTITKLATTAKCAQMEFAEQSFNANENRQIVQWIKEKETLIIDVGGITSAAIIKKEQTSAEGDQLKFAGLNFSAQEYGRLAKLVKEGADVEVTMEPEQGELFSKDKEQDDLLADDAGSDGDDETEPPAEPGGEKKKKTQKKKKQRTVGDLQKQAS